MSESEHEPQASTGRGLVLAPGCEPVRVRYKLVVEKRPEGDIARGTLIGRHAGLWPIWLEPDAQLRLKNGRGLPISLTDLIGDMAEFESTGTVPEL